MVVYIILFSRSNAKHECHWTYRNCAVIWISLFLLVHKYTRKSETVLLWVKNQVKGGVFFASKAILKFWVNLMYTQSNSSNFIIQLNNQLNGYTSTSTKFQLKSEQVSNIKLWSIQNRKKTLWLTDLHALITRSNSIGLT